MNKNNVEIHEEDSIDLIELFSTLWINKKFIVKVLHMHTFTIKFLKT